MCHSYIKLFTEGESASCDFCVFGREDFLMIPEERWSNVNLNSNSHCCIIEEDIVKVVNLAYFMPCGCKLLEYS